MKNRESRYPGRVKLTPVDAANGIYDMTRADEPRDPGTPLNKALLDYAVAACGVTAGTATALTLDDAFGGFTLIDGAKVNFRLHVASGANPTLNVNGTGAKGIIGMPISLPAGTWIAVRYDETNDVYVTDLLGGKTIIVKERLSNAASYVSVPIPPRCKHMHIVVHGGTTAASGSIDAAIVGASNAIGYTSSTKIEGAGNASFANATIKSRYNSLSGRRFCDAGVFAGSVIVEINIMFYDGVAVASLFAQGGTSDLYNIRSMAKMDTSEASTSVSISGCFAAESSIFAEVIEI